MAQSSDPTHPPTLLGGGLIRWETAGLLVERHYALAAG
jgi:hypothetical protein